MKKVRLLLILLFGLSLSISAQKPSKKDFVVMLKTKFGDMAIILYDQTPIHKENFLKLAQSGSYDSTYFHRVMEEFMIQGGDVFRKPNADKSGDRDQLQAEISGDNCYGPSKLHKVIQHIDNYNEIRHTIAYSDHHSDTPLLDWADEAIAVNPTNTLRELATQKKYKIIIW